MNRKTIMAMPVKYFWAMVVACAAGIVAGSFFDFNINVALANKTIIGAFFGLVHGGLLFQQLQRLQSS